MPAVTSNPPKIQVKSGFPLQSQHTLRDTPTRICVLMATGSNILLLREHSLVPAVVSLSVKDQPRYHRITLNSQVTLRHPEESVNGPSMGWYIRSNLTSYTHATAIPTGLMSLRANSEGDRLFLQYL